MLVHSARAKEVLYDSETVLRLVDHELGELCDPEPVGALAATLATVQHATAEIGQVLATLRSAQYALRGSAVDQLRDSTAKIHEVSSAFESATTELASGLDRAQTLLNQLDAIASGEPSDDASLGDAVAAAAEAAAVRGRLRKELLSMMGPLQLQNVTSQQLGHVSGMLADVEGRLHTVSDLLGSAPAPAS